ncbi:hypothetical protein GCM10023321_72470 [Pseudonocardia eucalypti]|uniref:WD40 repeat domain-containing protein n=2 Tax=Pseudonocardia eucalypti TaxID=648755 RepID=A0ABP9R867_9PSEU
MDSSGSGMQDIDGVRGTEVKYIHNGFHFPIGQALEQLGLQGAELADASFGTNKPTTRRPPSCLREPWDVSGAGFQMVEIIHATDLDCSPLGLSDGDIVLGTHSEPSDRSRQVYWTWTPEDPDHIHALDFEPTPVHGGCMNAAGVIAVIHGTGEHPEGTVLDVDGRSRQLEIPAGMGEPSLTAMNTSGEVCGSLSINLDFSDSDRSRPAFWDSNGKVHIMTALAVGTSGRSVDLTDDGIVLVWESYGVLGSAVTLWNPRTGGVSQVPGAIIPTARAESGEILGFNRENGRDVAVMSRDCQEWSDLPLNNGFAPASLNTILTIVGNVRSDGYTNGWLLRRGENHPNLLPTFRYHNTRPRHINAKGSIAGHLSTDNEQHVVLWTPST